MLPFDQDPAGCVLWFFLLRTANEPDTRRRWVMLNMQGRALPEDYPWTGGPRATMGELLELLSSMGRRRLDLRAQLLRVFATLEANGLIEVWAGDERHASAQRTITELGEELVRDESYPMYLGGFPEVIPRRRSSIVLLHGLDSEGDASSGTGFVVASDWICTAKHVVEDLQTFSVETHDGTQLPHQEAVRSKRWPQLDLALVPVMGLGSFAPPIPLGESPRLLTEALVLGFPRLPHAAATHLMAHTGAITALPDLGAVSETVALLSCDLRGGNSGAPVLDRRGRVISIVSARLAGLSGHDDPLSLLERIGYTATIPVGRLVDLAQEHGIDMC